MDSRIDSQNEREQVRDLFAVLADDTQWPILERLLEGPATQEQLQERTGLGQSQVSRALKYLRALGLIISPARRGNPHRVGHREEIFALLRAADRLAVQINEHRTRVQLQASRRTAKAELKGEALPERRTGGAEGATA